VTISRAEMVTFLLQLSAQPNKNLWLYVGRNVGMWAKTWANFRWHQGEL